MQKLSVIICTYNPVEQIFNKCLDCIIVACGRYMPLEIIIVDNNSSTPISEQAYIKSFSKRVSNCRLVVEKKQGLTPARLKGIEEAKGNLLAFIDDDNFIYPDFFSNAVHISDQFPYIGSFSGQVILEFECFPPAWTKRYWGLLVYREFSGNYWSNLPNLPNTMPCGAGLIVRRKVADYYNELHKSGRRNIQLDRSRGSLLSAGDNDLAACACDIGLGVGIFDSLKINHFIPKERTTESYLLKLAEGIAHSAVVFKSFRGEMPKEISMKTRIANTLRLLFMNRIGREFQRAVFRGEKMGKDNCENH